MTESLRCAAEGSTECKSAVFPLKKITQTGTERRFQSPVNLFCWLRLCSSFPSPALPTLTWGLCLVLLKVGAVWEERRE